ncbi:hypothetical protein E1292_46980 [Nonomuraea deserti]|uniref:Uncharacterized protein n=1 Tax=Nonomuraea deserti TaxID=1848322 RepID=A0A4R4UK41_9ACTN|nr:hypothetical protein E1292_46980 [Nonomuraea deserti]
MKEPHNITGGHQNHHAPFLERPRHLPPPTSYTRTARRPDGSRVDGGRVDGGRVDGGRVDGGRVDGGRVDGGRWSGGRWPGGRATAAARPDGWTAGRLDVGR